MNYINLRSQICNREISFVEADFYVDKRDRETRAVRWERLDDAAAFQCGLRGLWLLAIRIARRSWKTAHDIRKGLREDTR